MRSPRLSPVVLGCSALVFASCDSVQGYYGPCDEPVGLATGCDAQDEPEPITTAVDACFKLATCGIINIKTGVPDDHPDPDNYQDPFDLCVDRIQSSLGEDPGSLVLECIENATCNDLSYAEPEDPQNPSETEQMIAQVEGVIGWCGRFDPS